MLRRSPERTKLWKQLSSLVRSPASALAFARLPLRLRLRLLRLRLPGESRSDSRATEAGVWKICKGFFLRFIGPTRTTSTSAGGCTRSTTRGPGPGVGDRQATTMLFQWHGADIWSTGLRLRLGLRLGVSSTCTEKLGQKLSFDFAMAFQDVCCVDICFLGHGETSASLAVR